MPLSSGFTDSLHDLFHFLPKLAIKRLFGGAGIYTNGVIFALADDDVIWFKTDEESAPLFQAEGLDPFTFRDRHGDEMTMSYWRAPDAIWDDETACRHWVQIAVDAAVRKKSKSKSKKKSAAKTKPGSLLISGPWDDEKS